MNPAAAGAIGVQDGRTVGGPRGAAPATGSSHHQLRRLWRLWPLGLYTVLSLVLFGLPVLGRLGSRIIASDAIDSSQFMWFFAWWPHALLHG